MSRTIALITDFGNDDYYVGVMKGVIRSITSQVDLIDITHTIEPQNVRQAAFFLMNTYKYFPKGTIFLVVVDPGVGSTRHPIVVNADDYVFVAPDNGVLSYVLAQFDTYSVHELANSAYQLPEISNTFHGRDIFSPAAAHIASGVGIQEFGDQLERLVKLPLPELNFYNGILTGEVMNIDRFGNIITSIGFLEWITGDRLTFSSAFSTDLAKIPVLATEARVRINGHEINGICESYSESMRGDLLSVVGSGDYLEVAVNQGNAAKLIEVTIGDRVELTIGDIHAAIRD